MKVILQIFTGSWRGACPRAEEIIRKTGELASRMPVDRVIIGWNTDPSVYREVGAFLRGSGIGMLLWLPVFAETGGIAAPDGAADVFGKPVCPPALPEGEGFVFHCPSSARNLRIVTEIYERYFAGCGFDGVFLDRVRSQSFLAGVSGVLSCGCERCRKAFRAKGVDLDEVRELYERKKDAFFDLAACPADGWFVLADGTAQRFFDAKAEIIADAVAELSGYFRAKGLTVGLDLFAPLVSRWAGQDYALLSKHADFIKPMLYRRTEAPAGIEYEYALFEKHASGARGRGRFTMDRAFLDTQLEALRGLPCERYPGIEVNADGNLVRSDPGYIAESLAAVREHGLEGAALCWNILQAPAENLSAAVLT